MPDNQKLYPNTKPWAELTEKEKREVYLAHLARIQEKGRTMPGVLKDVQELTVLTGRTFTLRGTLLRWIRKNQEGLKTDLYINKAKRGYLKDLTNLDIKNAVEEILNTP